MPFSWWAKRPEKKCWRPSPSQIAVTAGIVGAFGAGVWVGYKALKPLMERFGCCGCGDQKKEMPED